MLDFIVLGQIPGTDIYLSFRYILVIIAIIIFGALLFWLVSALRNQKKHVQTVNPSTETSS